MATMAAVFSSDSPQLCNCTSLLISSLYGSPPGCWIAAGSRGAYCTSPVPQPPEDIWANGLRSTTLTYVAHMICQTVFSRHCGLAEEGDDTAICHFLTTCLSSRSPAEYRRRATPMKARVHSSIFFHHPAVQSQPQPHATQRVSLTHSGRTF
ncbi:hypothetical protein OH76DRAFT_791728 [Lentinus brumalis]|uniref:Uncharacterized protein n=1 Tax=Lentinus brumalis TaxID=2498619 RepID=A0A371D479_9APHY|nr:hypothetical protein OH76DRAFT_791728 [Polyporus brumalis]